MPQGEVDFGVFFGHWDFKYLSKNVFFIDIIMLSAAGLAVFSSYKGVSTMWKKMSEKLECNQAFKPSAKQFTVDFLWPSVKEIVSHKRFNECGANQNRVKGHQPLLLAFIGLFLLTGYSFISKDVFGIFFPSLHGPIPQWNPFKILGNISAVAMLFGIFVLWGNRSLEESETGNKGTFYDWFLIYEIAAVGITGLLAELLRLAGIGSLAYLIYYLHLVAVMMLFLYMPYTKFAHLVYRTFAMAFERFRESSFVTVKEEK
jgi:quinone-modifying oxidoreductase subunit QmoC